MKAFEIKVEGKSLDYRVPGMLDLADVRAFFERKYEVLKIWEGGRHVLAGVKKDGSVLFLKLATSEGISAVTKVEYDWNDDFNKNAGRKAHFWVPINFDCGFYKNKFFYLITDKFKGRLLVNWPGSKKTDFMSGNIDQILDFCEFIQKLQLRHLVDRFYLDQNYRDYFVSKTKAWLDAVPDDVRRKYDLESLFEIVKNGAYDLVSRPRHGDFAPWHIFSLGEGKFGLIDGEHALAGGVENYDICYFIQRVFSVLEAPDVAEQIFDKILRRDYKVDKLKTVLAARAIGGFLDESFNKQANYSFANKFKERVLNL